MKMSEAFYSMVIAGVRLDASISESGPWLVGYAGGVEMGHVPLGGTAQFFKTKVEQGRPGRQSCRSAWWICFSGERNPMIGPFTLSQARRIQKAFGVAFGSGFGVGLDTHGKFLRHNEAVLSSAAWSALVDLVAENPRLAANRRGGGIHFPEWADLALRAAAGRKKAA